MHHFRATLSIVILSLSLKSIASVPPSTACTEVSGYIQAVLTGASSGEFLAVPTGTFTSGYGNECLGSAPASGVGPALFNFCLSAPGVRQPLACQNCGSSSYLGITGYTDSGLAYIPQELNVRLMSGQDTTEIVNIPAEEADMFRVERSSGWLLDATDNSLTFSWDPSLPALSHFFTTTVQGQSVLTVTSGSPPLVPSDSVTLYFTQVLADDEYGCSGTTKFTCGPGLYCVGLYSGAYQCMTGSEVLALIDA